MTFPLDRLADIQASPDDYRLLERIKLTRMRSDQFPVILAPAIGDEIVMVIVDVETTGLRVDSSDVIELGLAEIEVSYSTGQVHKVNRVANHYNDPGYPIPEEITRITGITDAMVAGQSIGTDVFDDWFAYDPMTLAHNAKFDRPFFEKIAPSRYHSLRWCCSLEEASWQELGYEGTKLEYLALKLGGFYEGHRASIDCLATAWVLHQSPQAMGNILTAEGKRETKIKAIGSPFDVKDTLKDRNYRWDADEKVWHTTVAPEQEPEERTFLSMTYARGGDRASITHLTSRNRFKG